MRNSGASDANGSSRVPHRTLGSPGWKISSRSNVARSFSGSAMAAEADDIAPTQRPRVKSTNATRILSVPDFRSSMGLLYHTETRRVIPNLFNLRGREPHGRPTSVG